MAVIEPTCYEPCSPPFHRLNIEPVSEDWLSRPLWSVMIPTYNCAGYLRANLESVLAQDPGPEQMQIEVVDDCSTRDDPQAAVREWGKGRVLLFRQMVNVGHTRNFETCLRRSRGKLIHLLHGDDCVRAGFYQKMKEAFEQDQTIGAAFCRHITIDSEGNWTRIAEMEAQRSGVMRDLLERLAVRQRIQTPAIVVRREVYEKLGSFDRRLTWTEDWEMWARIAAHYPVWYEPEPLACYRIHGNSNTSRLVREGENLNDLQRTFEMIENYLPGREAKHRTDVGRELYAVDAIGRARTMLVSRDYLAAWAQVRGAFGLKTSRRVAVAAARLGGWAVYQGIKECFQRTLARQQPAES